MKPSTLAARYTIQREHTVKAKPRLIAEWEYNRFYSPTVTVTPDQTGDNEWVQWFGDVNSFVQPHRPVAGIAKARADGTVRPLGQFRDTPEQTRYYPSYEYDQYNYWSSLQRSQLTQQADGGYLFDTPIVLTTIYPQSIAVNKIVVGFELGYCKPKNTSVQVTTDGTTWTTIATNPAINGEGIATMWRGQFGWSDAPDYEWPVVIKGVRLNVYSVDTPYTHLDVLQISPRLENDLSDFVVDYTCDFNVSSPSFIAPMGKASSNQASVTLSNIDGRFNRNNPNSLYNGMIEKKVRFTMDIGIDTTAQGGTTDYEYIRQFTMWADAWGAASGNATSNVQVTLKDSSVILQERDMPAIYLENVTVGGIIGQTMDRIGFTSYVYSKDENELGQLIPFYWPSDTSEKQNPRWGRQKVSTQRPPNTTIWDELAALAEATQTAVYFDEWDQLQIVARKQMYNNGKPVNWNLDAVPNGAKLADVVSATNNFDLTSNQVELTYRPCAMSTDNNGFPVMATVWTPTAPTSTAIVPDLNSQATSTDIVLRASPLVKDLLAGGTDLWIEQDMAVIWDWESDVNIEGEVLHYLGKEYAYYDANNVLQTAVVTSLSDQQSYDAMNQYLSWKNSYTGRFVVTERGKMGTYAADHKISSDSYTALLTSYDNSVFSNLGDGYITQNNGYMTQYNAVVANVSPSWDTTYMLRKHEASVTPVVGPSGDKTVWYGAKLRFPSGYGPTEIRTSNSTTIIALSTPLDPNGGGSTPVDPKNPKDKPDLSTQTANWHIGGLFFAGDWGDSGYFLELTTTNQIDGWEQRQWRNEVCLIGMPGNAAAVQLKGTNAADASGKTDSSGNPLPIGAKGFQVGILEDQWYQVDVSYSEHGSDGQASIAVYINGVLSGTWSLYPATSTATTDPALKQPSNHTNQWRFGTHVRGPSMGMDIEYLYAVAEDETNPFLNPEQTSFLDLVSGGYASGFVYKNVKYNAGPTWSQPWPNSAILHPGQTLSSGHSIWSGNGLYTLIVQNDGNIVVYTPGSLPSWSTNTNSAYNLIMQTDGNLVAYNSNWVAVWNSGTAGNPGAFAVLQNDANFGVYSKDGHPLWAAYSEVNPVYSHMIIDEYGPVVHEIRSFDVQFNTSTIPAPASFLYLSNSAQVECLSYQSDAFGANFVLANASRQNAIVNGQDTITAGASHSIAQTILVYGRAVYTAQNDIFVYKKDLDAIRRQGLIRTQFTSRYIQTDEMANDIADWILSLWAMGIDEIDATIFGNPLLQVGDLVTMNFPARGMAPDTHQYFIIQIQNSFQNGYKTTVKLRRAHITGPVNPSV